MTSSKRPAKYASHEEEQVRRASSVADRMAYRRGSRVSARHEDRVSGETTVDYHEDLGKDGVKGDV